MNDFSLLFNAIVGWIADIANATGQIYIVPPGTTLLGVNFIWGLSVLQALTAIMIFGLVAWFFATFFKLDTGVSENGGDSSKIKVTYKKYKYFRSAK